MIKTAVQFIVFTAILLSSVHGFAQQAAGDSSAVEQISLRHIRGINCLDFTAGVNSFGHQFGLGYSAFLTDKINARLSINDESGVTGLTSYSSENVFLELNHNVFRLHQRLFLNLGYGALVGEESWSSEVFQIRATDFSYGLLVGANAEWYLFKKIALIAELKEIWDNGSSFGSFRYYLNAGLRFELY